MIRMYVRLRRATVICAVVIAVFKKEKKKPVGNSESEGILSDNCLSVWATVWWWQWWWEIQDSGWWCGGEPEKLGGEVQAAD